MTARLHKLFADLRATFWLVPACLVLAGITLAFALVRIDRSDLIPGWLLEDWLYDGGASGARTLLGAIVSSTIAVAGTVFSITIAALSLAAGQMGPRLLHNFTRDRGNQMTLGIFIATFAYGLVVLRTVRTQEEGQFTPHLALSVAILLAMLCLATLVYFVGHMAGRINVDTVIRLVSEDVRTTAERFTTKEDQADPPPADTWRHATVITDARRGYLQTLDGDGLADWAVKQNARIRMLIRPGEYVFPGAPIALVIPRVEGIEQAIRDATALGGVRDSPADLELAVGQLVEVAVRALSPGINDPHTAMSVLDRFGSVLCDLAPLKLQTGVWVREGRLALVVPHVSYGELCETMFAMIRQNAARSPAVLSHILKVLAVVLTVERSGHRQDILRMHADRILADAEREVGSPSDLTGIKRLHAGLSTQSRDGSAGHLLGEAA